MIVVDDTTPIITLMKLQQLELLENLFGAIYLPEAVYMELTCNPIFSEEAEEIQKAKFIERCQVEDGSLGILQVGFERKLLSVDEIRTSVQLLRSTQRHINEKLLQQLLERVERTL